MAIRKHIVDVIEDTNELNKGPDKRETVQQDVEYKVNVPIWSGLSNFHMLYLLKVMISWSNLKFPLYMALASSYAAAHIPNVKNLRLVNFQMMRALI